MNKKSWNISMNRTITLLLAILLSMVSVQGQTPENRSKDEHHDRVMKEKIAFFTQEMDLTVEEAQVFWPIYKAYWDELHQIHQSSRKAFKAIEALEELGDYTADEMNRRLDTYLACFDQESDVHKNYRKRFAEVLSVEKVARMFIAEEQFREQMIRNWQDKERKGPRRHE